MIIGPQALKKPAISFFSLLATTVFNAQAFAHNLGKIVIKSNAPIVYIRLTSIN